MRADLSTIQQTLTPEAAALLSRSIDEASRRRHAQTTPLHVASSLLSSPSSLLRLACSSPSTSSPHPLNCRALELCFSVALDRLPSSSNPNPNPNSPPVSNALLAALKRAQAHQRRGGGGGAGGTGSLDAPQPPLLAVKVELEQLVLSILDDPSVSRVMREASFNSAAVKTTIENSLLSSTSTSSSSSSIPSIPAPAAPSTPSPIHNPSFSLNSGKNSLYINPRLANAVPAQPVEGRRRVEEVRKVFEIMLRSNKRNPILVGDSDLESILKDALQKIGSSQAVPPLNSAQIFNLDPDFPQIGELGGVIEQKLSAASGIVVNLGDLKWLVEGRGVKPGLGVSEAGRTAVAEIARLLGRFNGGEEEEVVRVWLVGTADSDTFLRCQVYYPGVENEWDLHALPVAAAAPPRQPSLLSPSLINPRLITTGGTLTPSLRPIPSPGVIPLKHTPQTLLNNSNPSIRGRSMCQLCRAGYEREMGKLVAERYEKCNKSSAAAAAMAVSKSDSGKNLPHWLQLGPAQTEKSGGTDNIVQAKDQELIWKNQTEELQRKWRDTCSQLHPIKSNTMQLTLKIPSIIPSPLLSPISPNLAKGVGNVTKIMPQLKVPSFPQKPSLNSRSCDNNSIKTDLSLGAQKFSDSLSDQQKAKIACIADIDSFKKLLKDLKEHVPLQPNAASAVAAVVIQCRAGNGKRRGVVPRGDTWLIFVGADRIGKRKMAVALSESLFNSPPVIVSFGSGDRINPNGDFWGRTSLDRVVEAVRINPFSVILIEDIDRADTVVRGKIKRAIERGRLPDTHGREINLGNVTFILTTNWIHGETDPTHETLIRYEEKIIDLADSNSWQLELISSFVDESVKHRADWLCNDNRPHKIRKESALSLDLNLNLAIGSSVDDDICEESCNSIDSTVEHREPLDKGRLAVRSSMPSAIIELIDLVEESVLFEPVDFGPIKKHVLEDVTSKIVQVLGDGCSIRIDDEVIDRLVSGVWVHGAEIENWTEKILVPNIYKMKNNYNFMCGERKLMVRVATSVRYVSKGKKEGGLPADVVVTVNGR